MGGAGDASGNPRKRTAGVISLTQGSRTLGCCANTAQSSPGALGAMLRGPTERFITIVGGVVGMLVVFNEQLMDSAVGACQAIPSWWGLVLLGVLLLQALLRASYAEYREGQQELDRLREQLATPQSEAKILTCQFCSAPRHTKPKELGLAVRLLGHDAGCTLGAGSGWGNVQKGENGMKKRRLAAFGIAAMFATVIVASIAGALGPVLFASQTEAFPESDVDLSVVDDPAANNAKALRWTGPRQANKTPVMLSGRAVTLEVRARATADAGAHLLLYLYKGHRAWTPKWPMSGSTRRPTRSTS